MSPSPAFPRRRFVWSRTEGYTACSPFTHPLTLPLVLVEVALKLIRGVVPSADMIGVVGVVALAANLFCLALLARRRGDDINMRSTWLCSRNDAAANVGVLLAAAGVGLMNAAWPDIAVGSLIAGMFGSSAVGVLRAARQQLRLTPVP